MPPSSTTPRSPARGRQLEAARFQWPGARGCEPTGAVSAACLVLRKDRVSPGAPDPLPRDVLERLRHPSRLAASILVSALERVVIPLDPDLLDTRRPRSWTLATGRKTGP